MPAVAAVGAFLGTSAGAATVAGGLGLAGSALSARSQSKAAKSAANAETAAANAGIAENQRQFDLVQKLLQPYVQGGTNAFGAQQNLLGLNGNASQQSAIDAIQNSPLFQSQLQQGNNAILQQAAATGGLRGGNVQAAIGQFAPNLLNQAVQNQFANLGSLSSYGLGAATGTGNAAQSMASQNSALFGNIGQAQANSALLRGANNASFISGLANLGGNAILGYNGKGPLAGLF